MSASFDLSDPVKVTVGAVGPAGGRTFYLQARQEDRAVTLKLEKQQVAALAALLAEVLADLATPGPPPDPDSLELDEPVLADWAVGSMQLSFDPTADRVVLLAEELDTTGPQLPTDVDDPDDPGDLDEMSGDFDEAPSDGFAGPGGSGAIGRLAFTREQAAGLIRRGAELVSAGRPTCRHCGYPIDPAGHSCPKTNGHRAPTP